MLVAVTGPSGCTGVIRGAVMIVPVGLRCGDTAAVAAGRTGCAVASVWDVGGILYTGVLVVEVNGTVHGLLLLL